MSPAEEKAFERLKELWMSGRLATVIELARRHTAEYPQRTAPWIILGDASTQLALYGEADSALRMAERLSPKSRRPYVWLKRGDLHRAKGNPRLAEKWYRQAIEGEPENATYHLYLGSLLAQQGRFDEAKECHGRAVQLGTGAVDEGHYNLALILRAEGAYRQAMGHLEKALEIDPDYAEAREAMEDVAHALRIESGSDEPKWRSRDSERG